MDNEKTKAEPSAASAGSVAGDRDILARLRDWRSVHLARLHEVMSEAADEIEHLRTIMYRIVDEDCTVAIQNGTFYADDEPLFSVPCTPPTQPTPGECSLRNGCASGRETVR